MTNKELEDLIREQNDVIAKILKVLKAHQEILERKNASDLIAWGERNLYRQC